MLRIVVCISGSISNSFLSGYYGSAFSLAIWQFSVVNIIKGCYSVSNGKLTQLPVVDKPYQCSSRATVGDLQNYISFG